MTEAFSNWSGGLSFEPRELAHPGDEEELASLLRAAARRDERVRVVGTGHSSMPLVQTEGLLVNLDAIQGLAGPVDESGEVWVHAGTKIDRLSRELLDLGRALENQGDIDVQALGGAIGTATHGTGRSLGNLSTHVTGLRLLDASGEPRVIDGAEDPEALRGARVALGALGIVTQARLRTLPAYRLHEHVWREPIESCLAELERHIAENRHFEFFWFPSLDQAEMKTLNPTEEEPGSLEGVEGERVGWSADVISSVRELKFHEMEYAIPAEQGVECFRALRQRLRDKHPEVVWPIEYRTVRPDDAWLSPHAGRATVTLSIHQDGRYPFREFFADVEPLLVERAGRPHWGKVNTLGPQELAARYPDWERFVALRRKLDPDGRFLNDYLERLFA